MTVWAEKVVSTGTYGPIQDLFADLQMRLGAPEDLMLVCVNLPDWSKQRLIAGLPAPVYLDILPGFAEIPESALPKRAVGLVTNVAGFERVFEYDVIAE